MSKYSHIDFRPPASVAKEAEKGLKYREMAGGKGGLSVSEAKSEGVGSGVQRAVNLKNRDEMSPETVKRMKAFFDRHQKNKSVEKGKKPWEDRGYVAWCLTGDTNIHRRAVMLAMEKQDKPFSGGFNIMQEWQKQQVKKQKKEQEKSRS